MKAVNAVAAVLAFAVCLTAARADEARLDAAIGAYAQAHQFSGSVLVRREGRTLARASYGLADRALDVPTRPDTVYRIASITKLFTATLILQLREEGRIDLDAPVGRYLPSLSRGVERVTIAQLLHHTSGLPNMDNVKSYEEALARGVPGYQTPVTPRQLLERFGSGPLVRAPGAAFDYNNADFIVLGQVVEAIRGKPFEAVLNEHVLAPLAMRRTGMMRAQKIVPGLAATYLRPDEKAEFLRDLPVYDENWYAAGAMYSCTDDLATFAEALFGGRLVSATLLKALMTPGLGDYGLGLWVRKIKIGGKSYVTAERYGSIMGANGLLFAIPELRITIVILANSNAADMGDFVDHIAAALDQAR